MKTAQTEIPVNFDAIQFQPHPIAKEPMFKHAKQALLHFKNNYGLSIIFGSHQTIGFYSNGIDNYEVAILHGNDICYNTGITDNVLRYQSQSEVMELIQKVSNLPPKPNCNHKRIK